MFLLAKFFEKESYRAQFLSRELYLNRLQFFRKLEENSIRADGYEGSIWFSNDIEFVAQTGEDEYEEFTIRKEDLVEPVQFQASWTQHVNLFCMCVINIPDYIKGTSMRIPIANRLSVFGEYGVLLNNVPEFFNKLKYALGKTDRYRGAHGHVNYSDKSPEDIKSVKTLFHKREKYKDDMEYRIVVLTASEICDPLILKMGDLSDITTPFMINRQG